jgi:hypothetical protein
MYYEPYFPEPDDIIFNEGMRMGAITKRLTMRTWVSAGIKGEGKLGLIAAIKEAGRMEELVNEIKALAAEQKSILPPEVLQYNPKQKVADAPSEDKGEKTIKIAKKSKSKVVDADPLATE